MIYFIWQVLKLKSFSYTSKFDADSVASIIEEQSSIPKRFSSSISASNIFSGFQIQDLYNFFEVKLNDIEVRHFSLVSYCIPC